MPLTYEIDMSGKTLKAGITGTSATISGLTNFTKPTVSVVAVDQAGRSNPAASLKLDISPSMPLRTYQLHNRKDVSGGDGPVYVRNGPSSGAGTQVDVIQPASTPTITVICQVHGAHITDSYYSFINSYVWDKVEWKGGTAYIADPYLATPKSNANTYSDPPIWRCS